MKNHASQSNASATIEVDAHVGLLIHAIMTHGQSSAIVSAAVRELLISLDHGTLAHQTKTMYAKAFVETGALSALWSHLVTYIHQQEFQQAAFKLLFVVMDTIRGAQDIDFPSVRDLLDSATLVARCHVSTNQHDCVERLLTMLEQLAWRISDPADFTLLVDIITRIMIAPSIRADILAVCLHCISVVMSLSQQRLQSSARFKLSSTTISVIGKILSTNIDQVDHFEGNSTPLAIAILPTVLVLLEEQCDQNTTTLPLPIILSVLYATSRIRDLNEAEAKIVETSIGEPFDYIVKQFCEDCDHDKLSYQPSGAQTLKLSFALLWSSHASKFVKMNGSPRLLGLIEQAMETGDVEMAVSAARALHLLCATVPGLAVGTLENDRPIERLVQCVSASTNIGHDELLGELFTVLASFLDIDNFATFFIDIGGIDSIESILRNQAQFSFSVKHAIRLLGRMHTSNTKNSRVWETSSLPVLLSNCQFLGSQVHDRFLGEYICALSYVCGHCKIVELVSGAAKDIVRMMRLKIENGPLLLDACQLVLRLVGHQAIRVDLIDTGIVQVISKAMYLHERQDLQQSLCSILMQTLHNVDGKRNTSVLQTLVQMWKQSLTPSRDMDTYVESLELNCYAIAAILRLKSLSTSMPMVDVKVNLCRILQENINDHDQISPGAFSRVVKCCVYALACMFRNHALTTASNDVDSQTTRGVGDVPIQIQGPSNVLQLVVDSVAILIGHYGDLPSSAVACCCQFMWQLIIDHGRTLDASVMADVVQLSLKILEDDKCDPALLDPLLCSLTAIIATSGLDYKTNFDPFTAMIKVLKRLASQGVVANISCVYLSLQCLDTITWNPASRSHALVTACLNTLYEVIQACYSATNTILERCISISRALCTDVYIEAVVNYLYKATESSNEMNESGSHQLIDLAVCLAVMVTVDQQTPILKKRQLRQLAGQLVLRLARDECNEDSCRIQTTGILQSSWHLLSGRDQAEVINVCLDRLANGNESPLLSVIGAQKWPEREFFRLIETLTEAMAHSIQRDNLVIFARLCDSLTFILHDDIPHNTSHGTLLTETTKLAVIAMCESALTRLLAEDGTTWNIQVVVSVVTLHGCILMGSHTRVLDVDLCRLKIVCIRALTECFVQSAVVPADIAICGSLMFENLLISSALVLQEYVAESSDHARELLQDTTIQELLRRDPRSFGSNHKAHIRWCMTLAASFLEHHGAIFGEKVLKLFSRPAWMVAQVLKNQDGNIAKSSQWRKLLDCVAVSADCSGWGQLSPQEHMNIVVKVMDDILRPPNRRCLSTTGLINGVVQSVTTRLGLVLSFVLLGQGVSGSEGIQNMFDSCLRAAQLAQELHCSSALVLEHDYTITVNLILHISKCAIVGVQSREATSFVQAILVCILKHPLTDPSTLGAYLELATTVFLIEPSLALLDDFLSNCMGLLKIVMLNADVLRGDKQSDCFRSLRYVFSAVAMCFRGERTAESTALLVRLTETCASYSCVEGSLWSSLFELADGVNLLLDIASRCHQQSIREDILMFLQHQSIEVLRKPVRTSEREMQVILEVIRSNCVVSEHASSSPQTARSFAVIESALCVVKVLTRLKHCALAFCVIGGLQVLYDLLSSSVQDESTILLALEVCCYLTSHGENLVNSPTVFPLVKLLCLMTDLPERSHTLTRLAFVNLNQCIMLTPKMFTYSLTQIARSHLWKWRAQCVDEEIDEVIQKLYPLHVKQSRERTSSIKHREYEDTIEPEMKAKIAEEEQAIRQTIVRYFSVVQVPGSLPDDRNSYINVKTSIRSEDPSNDYCALHAALYCVRDRLVDPTFALNPAIVREILPSVTSIVILHASSTTDVVCVAMEIISNFSFILHQDNFAEQADVPALIGSCYLHATRSLPFAIHAAAFCENIIADARADVNHISGSMLKLIFTMMDHYPEDFDITQCCMSCLGGLLTKLGGLAVVSMEANVIAQLNRVLRNHAHDLSVMWKAIICLQRLVPCVGPLADGVVTDALSILLNVVTANSSHTFLARMALDCIDCFEQREQTTARQMLLEMDAIGMLVSIMCLHLDDESIVRISLRLLIVMIAVENEDDVAAALASLVERAGHLTMLAICEHHIDNLSICRMASQLLLRSLDFKDSLAGQQTTSQATPWQDRALNDMLSHDIVHLLFQIFETARHHHDGSTILLVVLEILCEILSTQPGRNSVEQANGLTKLRQIVDVVWFQRRNVLLLEAALDCLVNAACSTHFDVVWYDFPLWLTSLANSVHEQSVSPPSVETIVGLLLRLAAHPTVATELARTCSQMLLQMLIFVGEDINLEEQLLTLLTQLCLDPKNVPILIVFDAVATLLERIAVHVEREQETQLYLCLRVAATMASHPDCVSAFQERALHIILTAIRENLKSSVQLQQVAQEIHDRIPNPTVVAPATMGSPQPLATNPESLRPPEHLISDVGASDIAENNSDYSDSDRSPHREILWHGATFRMRRDAKQAKKRDKVIISLGESEEYFVLRNMSADPPTVERVFVSQLQVLPNTKAAAAEDRLASKSTSLSPRHHLSLSKVLAIPSLVRSVSRAECIFHVMIRDELVSLEANSPNERRAWEDALQWILHRPIATGAVTWHGSSQ